MSQGDDLLRAVLEAPDDDAPRLVYADWLLERGDRASQVRGEFIQVQCALAAMPDEPSPVRTRLARRQAELLASHRQRWIEAALTTERLTATSVGNHDVFERGFLAGLPTQISPYVASFLPGIFERTPLDRLRLTPAGGDLRPLLAMPALERLRELTLVLDMTNDLAPLFASERFLRLERLSIKCSTLEPPPLAELLQAPLARHVTSLELDWDFDYAEDLDLAWALDTIAMSARAAELRELRLSGRTIESTAALRDLPALRVFTLATRFQRVPLDGLHGLPLSSFALRSRVRPDADDLEQLLAITSTMPLDELQLYNVTDRAAFTALVSNELARQLRVLVVERSDLDDTSATTMQWARHVDHLRVLGLGRNPIGFDGARKLANAPQLASLRTLDLSYTDLRSGAPFANARHLHGLELLDLRGNELAKETREVEALAKRYGGALRY